MGDDRAVHGDLHRGATRIISGPRLIRIAETRYLVPALLVALRQRVTSPAPRSHIPTYGGFLESLGFY